jgi:hypothetical protein
VTKKVEATVALKALLKATHLVTKMVKYLELRKVQHLVLMKVEVTVSWMELKKRTRLVTKTVKYLGLRKD